MEKLNLAGIILHCYCIATAFMLVFAFFVWIACYCTITHALYEWVAGVGIASLVVSTTAAFVVNANNNEKK